MSHLSASQWISPLNLSFPVLNDPEQVTEQWTADTLRVAIVTPQATYLKEKGVGGILVWANFQPMCISLRLRGNQNNRIYTEGQKGPTDVKSCSHTLCLSTGEGAAQQEHTIPPTARHHAAFIESLPPAKQTDSKKKKKSPIIITSRLCRRHVRPGERRTQFIQKLLSFQIQSKENQCNAEIATLAADTNKWQQWMTIVPKSEVSNTHRGG